MGVVLLKRKLTSFQIIILGFSGVILFGTFLLMLPFSSRSGLATPFSDALFTSTSAVCVPCWRWEVTEICKSAFILDFKKNQRNWGVNPCRMLFYL